MKLFLQKKKKLPKSDWKHFPRPLKMRFDKSAISIITVDLTNWTLQSKRSKIIWIFFSPSRIFIKAVHLFNDCRLDVHFVRSIFLAEETTRTKWLLIWIDRNNNQVGKVLTHRPWPWTNSFFFQEQICTVLVSRQSKFVFFDTVWNDIENTTSLQKN